MDDSELRMRYGYEGEGEEEKRRPSKKKLDLSWAVYPGILIIAAIIAFIYFKQAIVWIGIGAIAGVIVALAYKKTDMKSLVLFILLFSTIGLLFDEFSGTAFADMQQVIAKAKLAGLYEDVKKPFICLTDYEACKQQFEYSPSTVKPSPKVYTNINFEGTPAVIENRPINIDARVIAMNQVYNAFIVNANCYIGTNKINAIPPSFSFPKSQNEQINRLLCSGNYQKGDLIVRLQSQYNSTAVLPIELDILEKVGTTKISEANDAPYLLSIDLSYNQPLKNGEYTLFIVLGKQYSQTLQSIESLKISTISKKATISCEDLPGLTANNLNKEALKQFLVDSAKDVYRWRCKLNIEDVDGLQKDTAYIKAEAIYTAESEYKTAVQISK